MTRAARSEWGRAATHRSWAAPLALALLTPLLPAAASAAESAQPTPDPARIEVIHAADGLRVHAIGARPEDVVQRIGDVIDFEVRVARDLGRTITLNFTGLTVEDALRRVLGRASVAMVYGPQQPPQPRRLEAVWIYGPGGPVSDLPRAAARPARAENGWRAHRVHRHPSTTTRGRAVAALTSNLRSPDQQVRADAVAALAALGGPAATLHLGEAVLGDVAPEVRLRAVRGLEAVGTDRARVFLEFAMDDPDPQVGATAADVLTRLP